MLSLEGGTPIVCAGCQHVLGALVRGVVVQRHKKRVSIGAYAIHCERCGTVWQDARPAAVLALRRA